MTFNSDTKPYFIPERDLYGLVRHNIGDITDTDFSFVVKCKPDWDSMLHLHQYCAVAKNGRHMGIFFTKLLDANNDLKKYIELGFWVTDEDDYKHDHIRLDVTDFDDELFVVLNHNVEEKKFQLVVNGQKEVVKYSSTLMDYSNSWIWVGAANDFPETSEEHKHFFLGEINFLGVYRKFLPMSDITKIEKGDIVQASNSSFNPGCVTDFTKATPYKVLDQSGMGNNLYISYYDYM